MAEGLSVIKNCCFKT